MKPLEIHDLRKQFGDVEALRGISFSVEPGEVFGYLGPNGAGKTTTLRVILGLVRASTGDVRVFGQTPAAPASRHAIGFIPGDLHLYSDMTAQATLDFFARFRPARPPSLRGQLLDTFGLDATTLGRRIKFLSHGTRQKIGLIAAMQHDPDLLLLDEPSNGLDPLVQRSFRGVVRDFAARGRAVLFSSHVLSEVEEISTRIAIVRRGEIVALETIDTLRANVVRRLAIRFRGAPPLDLLSLPAVTRHQLDEGKLTLWIRGDVNAIVRALVGLELDDLVFPEPELEDIFLSYYADA